MGKQNLHRFKAESGTGELMRGSFCEAVIHPGVADKSRYGNTSFRYESPQ